MNKWRKSSYSGHNGACVEVLLTDSVVGLRDSKNAGAGHVRLTAAGWSAFVDAVKSM